MTNNIYESPQSDISSMSDDVVSLTWGKILFSFKGRIPRKTYWGSFLGMMAASIIFVLITRLFELSENTFIVLFMIFYIPLIWVSLAIQVKRWHDRDKSGWWVLISFVPIIGPIWAFVENGCLPGSLGANNYGPPSV